MNDSYALIAAAWPGLGVAGPLSAEADWICFGLLRGSALLAVTGAAVWLLLKWTSIQSPTVTRYLALFILLQGCVFWRWTVDLPWKEPTSPAATVATEQAPHSISDEAATFHGDPLRGQELTPTQASNAAHAPASLHASAATRVWSWSQAIFAAWLLGLTGVGGLAVGLYLRLWMHVRSVPRVNAERLPEWTEALAAMGLPAHARVSLCFADRYGPGVVLLWRETVVLVPPDVWAAMNRAERMAMLRHELAHVRRHDLWKSFALRVLALPHWFNPWAWWSVSLFEEAAEWACDEMALGAGLSRRDYSRLLVDLSGTSSGYPARAFGARAARLAMRITLLMNPARAEQSTAKRTAIAAVVCVLLLANLVRVRLVESTVMAQQPAAAEIPDPAHHQPEASGQSADSQPRDVAAAAAADPDAPVLECLAVDEESAKPVSGAAVQISWETYAPETDPEETRGLYDKRLLTTTAADGKYQVVIPAWTRARPDLHVRVEITHSGYLHYWDSKLITDLLGNDPAKKQADFQRAALTPGREIAGRVVDPAGRPLGDVMLYKEYFKQPVVYDANLRVPRDNDFPRTDDDGRFRCLVAAKGYVAIRFRASPEFVELPYEMSAERDQGDIRLSYGTRFTGHVLTSAGEPLANGYVSVSIPNINGAPNTNCAADGSFTTEAFGIGKHTIRVGWAGPPGTPRGGAVWIPPELYLPAEFELNGAQRIQQVEFRPVDSVRVIAKVVSFPPQTGDTLSDLALHLPSLEIRGRYRGKPWKGGGVDLHDDGTGRSNPPRAPRGLTDVELWFGDLPQRIQLSRGAPLLFGSAMTLPRLDADLADLRIHRYAPCLVKIDVVSPEKPEDLKVVASYDREPEMRAAGMVFKTSEAAMGKKVDGDDIQYLVLPDEPVQFTITASGHQPFVQRMRLKEGETKSIAVKLVASR